MAFDHVAPGAPEHFDVLIVGAGISGIDAAYRLKEQCPGKRYAILEARDAIGGTWDLFKYPGIRSDSDMTTLGFPFEPWDSDVRIADGPAILEYIRSTARKHGIDRHIRLNQRVTAAAFDSKTARWTVTVDAGGKAKTYTCQFLQACSGYYDYAGGYTPAFTDIEKFGGRVVHPQKWPTDLDLAGKRVVVIGSGATAITLIPSLTKKAAHVTMLQRSPTYVFTLPRLDAVAGFLRRFMPNAASGAIVRWKNILLTILFYQYMRRRPEQAKRMVIKLAKQQAGPTVDVDTHFSPSYKPWDQRMCIVPNGDLFRVLKAGKASIVTDHIERFTKDGIRTKSGKNLPADVVVTATGLSIQLFGGASVTVDGVAVDTGKKTIYKGLALDGVPNFAFAFGYTNASWTLKCDLSAQYFCRLINELDRRGQQTFVARLDPSVKPEAMVDLTSGYIQRARAILPLQGPAAPWRVHQNYVRDLLDIRWSKLDDGAMQFGRQNASQPSNLERAPA